MRKPFYVKKEEFALPSPMEEAIGKTCDPRGHEAEIEKAKQVLHGFITDMNENRVPSATVEAVATAVDIMCTYGGHPISTFDFVAYLNSSYCTSYRNLAALLKDFLPKMSELIAWRLEKSALASTAECSVRSPARISDDDLPF